MKIKILGVDDIEPVSFVLVAFGIWCLGTLVVATLIVAAFVEVAILLFNLPARLLRPRQGR